MVDLVEDYKNIEKNWEFILKQPLRGWINNPSGVKKKTP